MARKGWNALSTNYRARLEKAGISKTDYEGGQSIQSARGHAATPERPTQANPTKHARYIKERDRLITRLTTNKEMWFGTSPKWNPLKKAKPFKDNPPSLALLRTWAAFSRDEWLNALHSGDESTSYLGYH